MPCKQWCMNANAPQMRVRSRKCPANNSVRLLWGLRCVSAIALQGGAQSKWHGGGALVAKIPTALKRQACKDH
eukprot:1117776-Pelagomonas_calceolata.AAC.5